MKILSRSLVVALVISLAAPILPLPASRVEAGTPGSKDIVAFGLLGAVVGILVYMGWKMDKEDKEKLTGSDVLRVAKAEQGGEILLITAPTREGEQMAGLGYGMSF